MKAGHVGGTCACLAIAVACAASELKNEIPRSQARPSPVEFRLCATVTKAEFGTPAAERAKVLLQTSRMLVAQFGRQFTPDEFVDASLLEVADCPQMERPTCSAANGQVYCSASAIHRSAMALLAQSSVWTIDQLEGQRRDGYVPSASPRLPATFGLFLADGAWIDLEKAAGATDSYDEWRHFVEDFGRAFDDLADPVLDGAPVDFVTFSNAAAFLTNEVVRTALEAREGRPTSEVSEAAVIAGLVFWSAYDMLLAAIVGHELGHASRRCSVETRSHAEERGDIDKVVEWERSCDRAITAREIEAEICGLRRVRASITKLRDDARTRASDLQTVEGAFQVSGAMAVESFALAAAWGLGWSGSGGPPEAQAAHLSSAARTYLMTREVGFSLARTDPASIECGAMLWLQIAPSLERRCQVDRLEPELGERARTCKSAMLERAQRGANAMEIMASNALCCAGFPL